ncbi:PREDICTED: uncharacterized protein LOC105620444 [Atta cephalotes]|uniref:Integrase catalytic domain-containing protein n=1 Tax=Atta cephalotes TaxID=12957 RepID=A0A158NIG6_ATTCE|nr:PREDICTED: uncharacterized protein LOC105620444 [Atta cephalotes]
MADVREREKIAKEIKKTSESIHKKHRALKTADIVEVRPYSSFNRSHHYILTVIDVLSKYAWIVPLKSKDESETAAIAEIIRASGRCSKNLQTDMGKEFYNADVQKILKKHDVNHYSTYSTLKASVIERFSNHNAQK